MNREILFRGKHIHALSANKHLDGTWVYGYLCDKNYINSIDDDEYGGHVGFYIEWKRRECHLRKDLVYWVKNSEFIGNIFDNPELLEGKSNEQ